jgi:hypothetical protein
MHGIGAGMSGGGHGGGSSSSDDGSSGGDGGEKPKPKEGGKLRIVTVATDPRWAERAQLVVSEIYLAGQDRHPHAHTDTHRVHLPPIPFCRPQLHYLNETVVQSIGQTTVADGVEHVHLEVALFTRSW